MRLTVLYSDGPSWRLHKQPGYRLDGLHPNPENKFPVYDLDDNAHQRSQNPTMTANLCVDAGMSLSVCVCIVTSGGGGANRLPPSPLPPIR